ncbi:condensation domain-containing protein, partial [Shewanella baltica]|uniref:condensation domain-containing protein n=1 Tax=Shewanella baltica TaxID=62322 RepID=UPI000B132B57
MLSLIIKIKRAGASIWTENNELKLSFNNGAASDDLLSEIKSSKNNLIAVLLGNKILSKKDFLEKAIIKSRGQECYPLSFSQQRLLFIELFENGSNAYHVPIFLTLKKNVDISVVIKSINFVAERHPVLKVLYEVNENGDLIQKIQTDPLYIQTRFVAGHNLSSIVKDDINRPFDLTCEASFRVCHYKTQDEEYLLLNIHHIAFDGWSTSLLFQELSTCFDAFNKNKLPELCDLDVNYIDYAVWQRELLTGPHLEHLLNYWRDHLSGYEHLNLPIDFERPARFDYQGNDHQFEIEQSLSQQLRAVAQSQNTTLYTVLLSGFYITLSALSGQKDLIVGTPSDNRQQVQTQSMIGFFVNTLALRVVIEPSMSVSRFIEQNHNMVIQAKLHQEVPFDQVVDLLEIERNLACHPLYQVMFSVQSFTNEKASQSPLSFADFGEVLQEDCFSVAKFDLSLNISDGQEQLFANFNYSCSLFDQSTITRFANMYQQVLSAMVADTNQAINGIMTLSSEDRKKVLYDWNQTAEPYPCDKTIHGLFEEQVARHPDGVAVV